MKRFPAGILFVIATALLVDCRCRTQYDSAATSECNNVAATQIRAKYDGGGIDLLEQKRLCEDCCHARGLDSVEPGPCECGKLGLDALLK